MSAKTVQKSATAPRILLRPEPGPSTLKERPWGGLRLWEHHGKQLGPDAALLGESWEFSTLEGSESRSEGQALGEVLGHALPFLVKLVDARRPLSIQVHPVPQRSAGKPGKEEAWVVLEAEDNACILAGLRPNIDAEKLEAALAQAEAQPDDPSPLFDCLQRHPVRPGSVVVIPPQTIHTIPGGILIAELQHPCDITYRFFDYGSERPLHRAEAFAALDPHAAPLVWHPELHIGRLELGGDRVRLLVLGPGQHRVEWADGERLVIPTLGRCRVQCEHEDEALTSPMLRLARHGPIDCRVEAGGLAIIAWLVDPEQPCGPDGKAPAAKAPLRPNSASPS